VTDPETRQIKDSRVLAAMSHPLRRRLLDVLKAYGPQPVGALAERTAQAPANVSHHMRVLRESGLVEEAADLARDRRERWWRMAAASFSWDSDAFGDDPATTVVVEAAQSLNLDRHVSLVRAWFADSSDPAASHWGNGPFSADRWLRLTPEELYAVSREIVAVFDRWAARDVPDDGRVREPVFVFAHGVPAKP
jgi:DNA-binding transcriptional ArsR family regulator